MEVVRRRVGRESKPNKSEITVGSRVRIPIEPSPEMIVDTIKENDEGRLEAWCIWFVMGNETRHLYRHKIYLDVLELIED